MIHQESIINLNFQVETRAGDSTMLNSSSTNSGATQAIFRCSISLPDPAYSCQETPPQRALKGQAEGKANL